VPVLDGEVSTALAVAAGREPRRLGLPAAREVAVVVDDVPVALAEIEGRVPPPAVEPLALRFEPVAIVIDPHVAATLGVAP
jgi:hypothetical protein